MYEISLMFLKNIFILHVRNICVVRVAPPYKQNEKMLQAFFFNFACYPLVEDVWDRERESSNMTSTIISNCTSFTSR